MIAPDNLPKSPGCYIFKDKDGSIIYIGKAKDLKKRVSSYFRKKGHDAKTEAMISNISSVDFFVTINEVEAFILENNLIKKHRPKYNIDLKDSKRFAFILVTDESFPRLLVARNRDMKGKYYGPFVSAEKRDEVLKILRTAFMIRTCNKLPKKACLRFHIGLCSAPCISNITADDYHKNVRRSEEFLKGHAEELILKLKGEMKSASDNLLFEKARMLRDQIAALESLSEKQRFEKDKRYDEDIINYIISDGKIYLIVFNISRGMLASKSEFSFDLIDGFLEDFVTMYYSENDVPKEIILPQALKDRSIKQYLEKLRGGKVDVLVPKIGDKKALLELVKRNIEISFLRESEMVNDLRNVLKLNANPDIIECFDISHISGTSSVGSMVRFSNGKPDKSQYRRFKIKTVEGSDDFASIKEIVKRRYNRLKIENAKLPDLAVIDGGRGQLNAALEALSGLEIKLPVIALAKRFEEIYVPGLSRPLQLRKDSKALKLLIQIRNEAHRFAIKYHKLLRSKRMLN
jgi:excinuclease ABC subunit C